MTENGFRRIALSMPLAAEGEHMDHPDFRVGGKIFATLPPKPEKNLGMVKLPPAEQRRFLKAKPAAFFAAAGAWGKHGCTYVRLAEVDRATLVLAMRSAWRYTAPKSLVSEFAPNDRN